jgi:hypothetical protein
MACTNNRAGWQVSRKTNDACRPPRSASVRIPGPGKPQPDVSKAILANGKAPVSPLPIRPDIANIGASLTRLIQGFDASLEDTAKTSLEQKK